MIKQNERLLNIVLLLTDILIIIVSLLISAYLRFFTTMFGPIGGHLSLELYVIFLYLVILPVYLILYFSFGLYKTYRNHKNIFSEASQIIKANIIAFIIIIAVLFIINQPNFSRILILLMVFFTTIFGILERSIVRKKLIDLRKQGKNLKHILIVGDNEMAYNFNRKINENSYLGYSIYGFLGREERVGLEIDGVPIVGAFKDLDALLAKHTFDRVILAIPLKYYKHLNELVTSCENAGIKAEIIPAYTEYFPAKPSVDMIEDIPIINIRYVPLDDPFNNAIKKLEDITVAIIAIIITSPIMLITAIAVKLSSPGPIIFKQERIGYKQNKFNMYKFRSMRVQDPDDEKSGWTTKDDPRKTRVGNFIRKTSIDELPQFFNVLKGEMSVVGPRPERPYFVNQFKKDIPKYMVKHQVRPGLTGWAQVHGCRGNTSIKKRIKYDIEYVENWHLGLDIGIMIKTILKHNPNAY